MNKTEFRKQYINIRNGLDKDTIYSSGKIIAEKFLNSNLYANADLILCYCSVGNEVSTYDIIRRCLDTGKMLAVPFCFGNQMHFRRIFSMSDLIDGAFGIPTSRIDKDINVSDFSNIVCIVPSVSIDKSLNRLGYGGGYYDRFLSSNFNIIKVSLCYHICISDVLPVDDNDCVMDFCITENQILGGSEIVR